MRGNDISGQGHLTHLSALHSMMKTKRF